MADVARAVGGWGGFLGLSPAAAQVARGEAVGAFSTGRGALAAVLAHLRPREVYAAWYTCPVVSEVLRASGARVRWVHLEDDTLRFSLPAEVASSAVVVLPNLFGLMDRDAAEWSDRFGAKLVVDDAQAWYHRPAPGVWAFDSARKFFGVPDGSNLRGPVTLRPTGPRFVADARHLEARAAGSADAHAEFVRAEARLGDPDAQVSLLAIALMALEDVDTAASRRRENHRRLADRLDPVNRLVAPLSAEAVPLCYPLLPRGTVERSELSARRVWVPRYWPAMPDGGTSWEREVVDHLLALPVDQRLDGSDADHVAAQLLELIR